MNTRPIRPGIVGFLAAALLLAAFAPAGLRAGRPEPVSERAERGRVAVKVSGPEFERPGTYYVGQDASLNDLFARAGVKNVAFVSSVVIQREREGKQLRFRVPMKSLDLQFDFQEGDLLRCMESIF